MNKKVIQFLKSRPDLYADSDDAFWDDEHISKYMLASHLDPKSNNASRKRDNIINSVNWMTTISKGPKLLDLGCGPGIYAELLAQRGFQVTGIDFSKRSIDYAVESSRKNKLDIEYHYQNYLDMDYSEEFDMAILVYCDLGVLSPDNRKILLDKIYQALKLGGILILDVFSEQYVRSFKEVQSVRYEKGGFWSPDEYVVLQRNLYYKDSNNTLEQYLVITEDKTKCYNIWNQIYTKESFEKEVSAVGLEVVDIFDDVLGNGYSGNADTLCGVFKKV